MIFMKSLTSKHQPHLTSPHLKHPENIIQLMGQPSITELLPEKLVNCALKIPYYTPFRTLFYFPL